MAGINNGYLMRTNYMLSWTFPIQLFRFFVIEFVGVRLGDDIQTRQVFLFLFILFHRPAPFRLSFTHRNDKEINLD